MHFSCRFWQFTSFLLAQHIPGWEGQVECLKAINNDSIPNATGKNFSEQMLQYKSMCTHTHTHTLTHHVTSHSSSRSPTYPCSNEVDTKQLKILLAHMSRILWVQLMSPEAASAFLCQRYRGLRAESYTRTLFTFRLMAGLLMRALLLIITLWSPPSLQHKGFQRNLPDNLLLLKRD